MEPRTSKKDYKNHQYSGRRKSRKRVQGQMKRHHGENKSRNEVWCKKMKNDDSNITLNSTMSKRGRPRRYCTNHFCDKQLKEAVKFVAAGMSINKAMTITGIGAARIKKYYNMYLNNDEINTSCCTTDDHIIEEIFSKDQEKLVKDRFKQFQSIFDRLSDKECRMLAYQMAVILNLDPPNTWQFFSMSTTEWLTRFKSRHQDMKFLSPDRCTGQTLRSTVWAKSKISQFYDDLEKLIQSNPFIKDSGRIYNLDETYTSLDLLRREVNRDSKCNVVSTCCIVGASGICLPPFIMVPYETVDDPDLATPPGAKIITAPLGSITPDLFPKVMEHFIKHTNTSKQNPCVLIMDIDICHLSISAIDLAEESGVHILMIHPHMSKLMQPLVAELYEPYHAAYYHGLKSSMAERNRWDPASNFAKIAGEAYVKTMTPESIKSAFKKCGIAPFDRDLFVESDFKTVTKGPRTLFDLVCLECKLRTEKSKQAIDIADEGPSTPETIAASSKNGSETVPSKKPFQFRLPATSKSGTTDMTETQKGVELDKLKRRLIRAVARLLKEKKSEDEVWQELKKESGSNCKNLWERMRSLTMKKLKRLIDADDRVDNVPAVARMTLTDWLLYDLVIVHEKVDVIDRTEPRTSKVLDNLFSLVQMFSIEGRKGDNLAEAWTAATVYYNSKGHKCSPMLLQRRWYQIKELTRHKLYKFWFNYRGNERLLTNAKQDPPTELQKAIALRYPEIITKPFPEWEERIEKKLVIMPDEFEIKMRKKALMKPSDENAPDVVIVEKKIDTITLADSESENSEDESGGVLDDAINTNEDETSKIPIIVQVKTEVEDPYDNIDIEEHSVYQPTEPVDRFQDEIERLEKEEEQILTGGDDDNGTIQKADPGSTMMLPLITNVMGAFATEKVEATQDDVIMEDNGFENNTEAHAADKTGKEELSKGEVLCEDKVKRTENKYCDENSQESILIDDEDEDEIVPLKKMTDKSNKEPDQIEDENLNSKEIVNTNEDANIQMYIKLVNKNKTPATDAITPDTTVVNEVYPVISTILSGSKVGTNVGMVSLEDKEENKDVGVQHTVQDSEDSPEHDDDDVQLIEPDTPVSHNLDLAEDIVSDMNFADDGIEFADDGIELIGDDSDSNQNELDETHGEEDEDNQSPPKFDLKLLMTPIVYTTKLDDMTVYKNVPLFDTIDEKEVLDIINIESKPVVPSPKTESINVDLVNVEHTDINEVDDDLFQNQSSDESDSDDIKESERVKISSSLLQKPRSRSYNPIQLCKNPDFNTRLKRLTVGFFSSMRNRVLLKACKPMTIDLSKAFESKLVDGTLYLKRNDNVVEIIEREENINKSLGSVLPSAVAVQSLMDTTDVDKILEEELRKRMLERNKTINLPNISVVRQINQQLQMAEVAPIMAQTDRSSITGSPHNVEQTVTTIEKETPHDNGTSHLMSHNPLLRPLDKSPVNVRLSTDSTINQVNKQPTNMNEPQSLADTNKSKNDKVPDKPKKKERIRPQNMPSWFIKNSQKECVASDSLLTIDTLYKMLNALDPCEEFASKLNKPKYSNKSYRFQKLESTKEHKKDSLLKQPHVVSIQREKGAFLDTKTTKYCCWANIKILKLQGLSVRLCKHKCSTACVCCCRHRLKQLVLENNEKVKGIMKITKKQADENVSNAITKEQADNNLSNAIESVVQQAYVTKEIESPAVQIVNAYSGPAQKQPNPMKNVSIDIGIQADFDEFDTYRIIDNSAIDVDENPTQKTVQEATVSEKVTCEEGTIDLDANDTNEELSPVPLIRIYAGNKNTQKEFITDKSTKSKPTGMIMATTSTIVPIQEKPPRIKPKPVDIIPVESLYKRFHKQSEVESEVPCSCRPNVVVDRSSATLLVDGSNECLRHTRSRVSKETRIYLNRKHMSVTERPFYVGKNKILLTNVKQPKPQLPPPDPNAPITMPEGVQVVLLPDGTITYLVNPDVELTPEQLNAMPIILATIMEQIKAAGVTLPVEPLETSSVINNLDGDVEKTKPNDNTDKIQNPENTDENNGDDKQIQEKSNETEEDRSIAAPDSTPNAKEDCITTTSVVDQKHLNTNNAVSEVAKNISKEEKQTLPINETGSNKETHPAVNNSETEKPAPSTEPAVTEIVKESTGNEQKSLSENLEANKVVASAETAESNNAAENVNSRNLLSDLMEMSGIIEEDVAPIPQEVSASQQGSVMQPITLETAEPAFVDISSMSVPPLSPFGARKHSISAQIDEKIHELNPITSFAELKYACDNNGLFFKLDLTSGVIVPINVCIQKTQTDSAISNISMHPTEVIDLTDDQGMAINNESSIIVPPTKTAKTKDLVKLVPRRISTMMQGPDKQNGETVGLCIGPTISPSLTTPLLAKRSIKITLDKRGEESTPPKFLGISVEQKKKDLLNRLSNKLKPFKPSILQKGRPNSLLKRNIFGIVPLRRTVNSKKIEAKIDLVDSDAPMEEEYLLESSDDSSDDEPLAKKAKRIRSVDETLQIQNVHISESTRSADETLSGPKENVSQENMDIDFETVIDACKLPVSGILDENVEPPPVPTQLVLTGAAINQGIPLTESYLPSDADDEDSQEDCILGV